LIYWVQYAINIDVVRGTAAPKAPQKDSSHIPCEGARIANPIGRKMLEPLPKPQGTTPNQDRRNTP
jgi:hypothetical protein